MRTDKISQNSSIWKKGVLVFLVMLAALAPLAGQAHAATLDAALSATDGYAGQGRLVCEGTGSAVLAMSGQVHVTAMGGGNAYIHSAETVRAHGQGRRVDRGQWTILYGWQGEVTVDGRHFQVQLAGRDADFVATGKGHARVRGEGSCTVNGRVIPLTPVFQDIEVD